MIDKPFQEILDGIAPKPSFAVPQGFPLPWQIQTMYRTMITYYKFSFNGTWELQKPRYPDVIITPPESDFTNLFQPPDFSGVDSSNPIVDVCEMFISLFEWSVKELEAAAKLAGDLVKMAVSPFTYVPRVGVYELAMKVWGVVMKTHDVLAHTGLVSPHSEQLYDNGELRLPNEIDIPLITLGSSVDSAFRQALKDAIDPLGNLDKDEDAIGINHSVTDPLYPYYSVIRYQYDKGKIIRPPEGWEFRRPWAYPDKSIYKNSIFETSWPTPTETYNPRKSDPEAPDEAFMPLRPGPYPEGTRPDHVFFRTNAPVNPEIRDAYENAQTPYQTDQLNETNIFKDRQGFSPLGDPVPFSAYLIGRMANETGYATQFNLDSDRGFGYLTWDWIRNEKKEKEKNGMHSFNPPVVRPEGDENWLPDTANLNDVGKEPMQLKYIDTAPQKVYYDIQEIKKKNKRKK